MLKIYTGKEEPEKDKPTTKQNNLRFRKTKGFIKCLINGIVAFGMFHGGTQLVYDHYEIERERNPSRVRQEFYDQHHVNLRGWEEDIEENPELVSRISEELHRHRRFGQITIDNFTIVSRNYLKKNFFQQARCLVRGGEAGGYYSSLDSAIDLFKDSPEEVICHELSHDKTFNKIKNDPRLIEKFETRFYGNSRANQSDGSTSKDLERLTDEDINDGFCTSYSKKDGIEDLAEMSKFARIGQNDPLYKLIFIKKNQKIIEKVKYAMKLDIIPCEFIDYLRIRKLGFDYLKDMKSSPEQANEFLRESKDFVEKYSWSTYNCDLYQMRGSVLQNLESKYTMNGNIDRVGDYSASDHELKLALSMKFKDKVSFRSAIRTLGVNRILSGDSEGARIYENALEEHERRYQRGDVNLSYYGVNDYLEAKGINIDPNEQRKLQYIGGMR